MTMVPREQDEESAPLRLLRVGTWFLVPSASETDNTKLVASLIGALKQDTRVLEVLAPNLNDYWTTRISAHPDMARSSSEGVLTGGDSFKILTLSEHLAFKVRVPVKNQPQQHGHDDVPSDTYWVAWNGVSIFVTWEQDDDLIPISGGHVVEQVLRDVLERIDCGLYVQSCGPNCHYGFLHTNVVLGVDEELGEKYCEVRERDDRALACIMSFDVGDPLQRVALVALGLSSGLDDFAEYKNVGRRVIDLESVIRTDLAHLLMHYHEHARIVAAGKSPRALWTRWRARSWRREAGTLISGIWLGMANIETARRAWVDERVSVNSSPEVLPLLEQDFRRDVQAIEAMTMEPIAQTVNQVAASLDNRLVVVATLWGALAGAVAGGAAGILGGG